MDIGTLREFIVFSRHMNITNAATELHLAPSSLSRHITAMEKELGVDLVEHKATKLQLTTAGSRLLETACAITAQYDGLLQWVRTEQDFPAFDVRVAYALDDRTVIDALSLARSALSEQGYEVRVLPELIRGKTAFEALARGEIDLAIMYDVTQVDESEYVVKPIVEGDEILIALPKNEKTKNLESVTLADLSSLTVPWPSASTDNYLNRALSMFSEGEARPTVSWIDAENMETFFMHSLEEREMWFMSRWQFERYPGSFPLSYRNSIVVCRVRDVESSLTRYAVYKADNDNVGAEFLANALTEVELD